MENTKKKYAKRNISEANYIKYGKDIICYTNSQIYMVVCIGAHLDALNKQRNLSSSKISKTNKRFISLRMPHVQDRG